MRCHILLLFTFLICINTSILAATEDDNRGLSWQGPAKSTPVSIESGKYYAIVIGNNNYQDKNGMWTSLKTATNDARALARLLKEEYDFSEVNILLNATRRQILKALNNMSSKIDVNDNMLIYYAGHGHLEDNQLRGYWIPVDAEGGDNSTYLRNSTIRDEINILSSKSKHTLLISDSCFSGQLLRTGGRGPSANERVSGYYQKVASKKSVQVLTAGGKEFVDDNYRNSGHSPFTYFLLSELKNNPYNMVSLTELATSVTKAVANNVDQTPESGVLHGTGDELGEFIFVKRGGIKPVLNASSQKASNNVINNRNLPTDDKNMEVKATFLFNHLGTLFSAGLEYYINDTISFTGKFSQFDYTFEDDSYTENGYGTMFGISRRSYDKASHLGRYFGIGVDFVSGNWDSREYDSGSYINSEGKISGSVPNVTTGYKGTFGDLLYEFNAYFGFITGQSATPVLFGIGLSISKDL